MIKTRQQIVDFGSQAQPQPAEQLAQKAGQDMVEQMQALAGQMRSRNDELEHEVAHKQAQLTALDESV